MMSNGEAPSVTWLRSPYTELSWLEALARSFGGSAAILRPPVAGFDDVELPVLHGSRLSSGQAFSCGAIGYGGAYHSREPITTFETTRRVVLEAERYVGCPCERLVSPLFKTPQKDWPGAEKTTYVKVIEECQGDLLASYTKKRRYDVTNGMSERKLSLLALDLDSVGAALSVLNQTQARVDSAYRTPRDLVRDFCDPTAPGLTGWGGVLGKDLVAVALFAMGDLAAALYMTGRTGACPTYGGSLLTHYALTVMQAMGVREVDFGYSHSGDISAWKRRWGVSLGYSYLAHVSDLGGQNDGR